MSKEQKTAEEVTDDLIPKPPHPANQTIIIYQDGHKEVYGGTKDEE